MYYLGQFIYKNTEKYSPLFVNKFSVYYRYRFYAFVLMFCAIGFIEGRCPTYPDFVKKSLSKQKCSKAILIKPSDIGTTGYIISKSGTYCLSGNVSFKPTKPGQAAITITADQVNLILSGATITQKGKAANTHGVYVDSADETTVYGGTLKGFTGNGMYFYHATAAVAEKIISSYNVGSGLYFEQGDGIFVVLCTAKYNGTKGIWLDSSDNILLEACTCSKNYNNQDIDIS